MFKVILISCCLALGAYNASAIDSTYSKITFEILPDHKLIPIFAADGRAHRLSALNILGGNDFVGSMGGIFPIVNVKHSEHILQFSAASSLYTTLKRYIDHGILFNVDFFVDLYFDYQINKNFFIRTGAGHTSQHLSDDGSAYRVPINYVRDYVELVCYYKLPQKHLGIYAGYFLNHNLKTTDATKSYNYSGQPLLQFGFEHAPFSISEHGRFFYALDLKFRGELDYRVTRNFLSGIRFSKPDGRSIRLAYNMSGGPDERGQLYTNNHLFYGVGVYLEF